jgi:hypothetical protein
MVVRLHELTVHADTSNVRAFFNALLIPLIVG